jgi:hypothetical protein
MKIVLASTVITVAASAADCEKVRLESSVMNAESIYLRRQELVENTQRVIRASLQVIDETKTTIEKSRASYQKSKALLRQLEHSSLKNHMDLRESDDPGASAGNRL